MASPAAFQLRDTMTKELGWNVQIAQWMQKAEVNVSWSGATTDIAG
jgi:hypothetical protein